MLDRTKLNMQDTIVFFKTLFTAPHRAYAEAMTLFTAQQRWRYFRLAMILTAICLIIPSLLAFAVVAGTDQMATGAVYLVVGVGSVFCIHFFNVKCMPNLLYIVGGWFKGQASLDELRELSVFNYFVWMSLGTFGILSVLLFPLSVVFCLIFEVVALMFYIKGLQYIQKYDLLDAIFTAALCYFIVVILVVGLFACFSAGLLSLVTFKSSLLGF